jgi:hypothetical protein
LIFSASRRTDIPAFYGEWFLGRLRAGEIMSRNPVNPRQITRFIFTPGDIEGIVFWTKDPRNFMKYLDEVDSMGYRYYFQFTVTAYGKDMEPGIDKEGIPGAFIRLSERIGSDRVIWRYDPILVNQRYSVGFHAEHFGRLAEKLHRYTEKCVISFVDPYGFLAEDFRDYDISEPSAREIEELAAGIRGIAGSLSPGLTVASCCEGGGLARYGIGGNKCIDDELIARISGRPGKYKKDPSQRRGCGCTASRDIGAYHTCPHGCRYCYAKRGEAGPYRRDSPLLCGVVDPERDRVNTVILGGARDKEVRQGF